MRHSVLTAFGIFALLFVLFFGKLAWDEYQQRRAIQHIPEVVRLIDTVELPQQVTLIKDDGVGTNEYSAVVWRYYLTDIEPSVLEVHFRKQAENVGFSECSKWITQYAMEFACKKGEYELRMIINNERQFGSNLGISANWYGG